MTNEKCPSPLHLQRTVDNYRWRQQYLIAFGHSIALHNVSVSMYNNLTITQSITLYIFKLYYYYTRNGSRLLAHFYML